MDGTLFLIDGHAIAYRSYFALTAGTNSTRWQTSSGEPTAGIFGFASILLRILEKDRPEYLAVAFDTGKTFRNDMYPEYKATRAKMPEDLRPQIDRMREMIDDFGFPRLEMQGYEADDVLGSVARNAEADNCNVKIITGDRDLLQLVDDHICVSLAGSRLSDSTDYCNNDLVKNYLGVTPAEVVDYKALVGDPSDNYPGVPGIGPKTAVKLLDQFKTLDGIYAHLDEIQGAVKTKLENHKDSAYLSQDLARIRTNLDKKVDFSAAATKNINFPAVEQLFKTLEFNTMIPKLRKIVPLFQPESQPSLFSMNVFADPTAEKKESSIETHIITEKTDLIAAAESLKKAGLFALDTETTGIDPMNCALVGISFAYETGSSFYVPVGHLTGEEQLPIAEIQSVLGPVFADESIKKAGHNIKFDALVLRNNGLPIHGIAFDSMIAGWVIEPTSKSLGLKSMSESLLGKEMIHIEELIGTGKKQRTMAEVPVKEAAPYAAADAETVLELMPKLKELLEQRDTSHIFEKIEIPLIPVLIDMEMKGISLNAAFLKDLSGKIAVRLAEIEEQIYSQVGYRFNINSTQQLSKALFETLGLSFPGSKKKTSSGLYSTAADVLEEMRGIHPVIDLILEDRELSKIKSTYADALPEAINPITGRIHTSFNQAGTVTGRLASASPNLQNIPTRTDLGKQIREAFTAAPGKILLSVDYSQIELRIVAHMAQDKSMIAAFEAGEDIHAATAAAIYGCSLADVTPEMRRHAKAINFGLIYGMSAFGLSQSTGLTPAEASEFVKAYFMQFPQIQTFLNGVKIQASEQGWVETIMGRKRYFPDLKNEMNHNLRSREEREAINAPVQGTAADIIKLAMIELPQALKESGLKADILIQVHDELLLEVPEEELDKTREVVQNVMENAAKLTVPILTEAKSGKTWGSLAPMGKKKEEHAG